MAYYFIDVDYSGWETRRRWRTWSRTSVRRELRRAHREGVRITADGLVSAGMGELYSAVRMLFGGMRRARRESRIDFPLIEKMPESELLGILRGCVRADGTLRRADVSSTSIYNAVLARYGGMDGARRALGVAGPRDAGKSPSASKRGPSASKRGPSASKRGPSASKRRATGKKTSKKKPAGAKPKSARRRRR